jgi:CheY-like chemotaxis protein
MKVALLLLQRLGYRGDPVRNGVECLEAVRRLPYDVILMDMQMPEMDGIECTRRLRAEGNNIRVIALTADALIDAQGRCLQAGMNDYVTKPIARDKLERALRRAHRALPKNVAKAADPNPANFAAAAHAVATIPLTSVPGAAPTEASASTARALRAVSSTLPKITRDAPAAAPAAAEVPPAEITPDAPIDPESKNTAIDVPKPSPEAPSADKPPEPAATPSA